MADDSKTTQGRFSQPGRNARQSAFHQTASAGLQTAGGMAFFDYGDRRLRNSQVAYRIYSEMGDDSAAGALLYLATNIIRSLDWTVRPSGESPEHEAAAQFLEECMDDMELPWAEFLTEAASGSAQYGHAPYEVTYKARNGQKAEDSDEASSKFSDGKVGWGNFQLIGQDTIYQWEFDEQNKITGLWQMGTYSNLTQRVRIDASRLINFRNSPYKDNPIGRSMYRRAHRAWLRRCALEDIECIGVERRMCGTPVIHAPMEVLDESPDSQYTGIRDSLRQILNDFNVDEQSGILFPNEVDPTTKQPRYRLEILSGGDSAAVDITRIIERYNNDIFRSSLADFLGLGTGTSSSGSYALSRTKSEIYLLGLKAYARNIADTVNRVIVPRLFAMNGMNLELCPEVDHSAIEQVDVEMICTSLQNLSAAGFQVVDPDVLARVFEMMGLPTPKAAQAADGPQPGDLPMPGAQDDGAADGDLPEGRPVPPATPRTGRDPDGTEVGQPKEQQRSAGGATQPSV